MSVMRKLFLARTVAVVAFAVAAGVANAQLVQEIKSRGVLLVGVEGKGYGGFMQVKGDGSLDGHDPELSALVARRLGVKLQLVDTAWAGIIPALYAKRFDMVLGGMTITKARAERVNFSIPYADGSHVLMAPASSRIASAKDLSGKVLASQLGSASLNFLKSLEGEVKAGGGAGFSQTKEYENFPEATLELANGRLDGLLIPKPVALEFIGKTPGKFKITLEFPNKRYFGAAIRKEDGDLLGVVNETIRAAKADGTLTKMQVKWFGSSMGDLPEQFTPTE